jgi:hypothetical protein
VALAALAAQAVSAELGNGAQKVTLERAGGTFIEKAVFFAVLNLKCTQNAPQTSPFAPGALARAEGFAVIQRHDNHAVAAEVVVQGAVPNATYTVELVQTPAGPCTAGTLTTDALGDGSVHLSAPLASVTNNVWVATYGLNGLGENDFGGTPDVTIG